jgi:Family of unknown function (DUF5318)
VLAQPSRIVSRVRSRRSLIDYSLARRASLARLSTGQAGHSDACDAHPYLLRAAKYHGEPTETPCPVCRRARLTNVTYTYGQELGEHSGRVRRTRELAAMEAAYAEFTVYVVEVCQDCGWNHLTLSYVLGSGVSRQRRRRRAAQT